MTGYRSGWSRIVTSRPDPETVKRDGWRETGILAVHPDDPRLDFVEREVVQRIGNRLYGQADAGLSQSGPASNVQRLRR